MAPKEQKSKKAIKEKQNRAIEDATFGLKNKNKSKKVQGFVDNVNRGVKNSTLGKEQLRAKEAKEKQRLLKKEEEAQERLAAARGEGAFVEDDKPSRPEETKEEMAARLGVDLEVLTDELMEAIREMELSDDDSSDEEEEQEDTEILVELEEEDETNEVGGDEVFYERTIEDIIEEQRATLAAAGLKGTPVTESSFKLWKEKKKVKRQLELEERVKAEQGKKKGGKGLSVLSGKELFNFDNSLFKDDADGGGGFSAGDMNLIEMERKQREEREALLQKAEEERAQKEQDRLMEAAQAENDAARLRLSNRQAAVEAPDAPTFEFEGVIVNAHVFGYDEMEDLLPFRFDGMGIGSSKKALGAALSAQSAGASS